MTAPQKKSHQDGLARLVHDLKSTKTLCRVKDYPGVSVEQLNEYVKEHGPLVHPVVGEQPGFFVDEGRFIPFRKVVPGRGMIGTEISGAIRDWIRWSGHGGSVTDAQGEFMIDNTMLRIPDVAYIPREHARQLTDAQRWTRAGEPFAPTFVVEIDTLTGPHSNLDALDHKMRREYFPHGVQLGWLIDPKNKIMNPARRRKKKLILFAQKMTVDNDSVNVVHGLLIKNHTVLQVRELGVGRIVRTIS
ncbi:TPA: hypothetical protein N0F65_011614 [Lagenidium giganteum]|uniref:Putative restriction endonuclease domain-containing protein n=1 Tax=Lagenidium giganteum TaxID=4803 RepID=A0AAV2ZBD1_9STRA|nr:TPA: hypothetical protein N0F65_011614 [Lagenidium giganteum]